MSEVARIKAQIDAETEAAQQALTGFAEGTTRHSFISARYDRLGELRDELSGHIGHDAAMGVIINSLEKNGVQR